MSKREQLPPSIGPFSPAHQPDEGYSEDPLNPISISDQIASVFSSLRSPADLPQWVAANGSLLPVSVKAKLAMALLDQLPTSAIVQIVERLSPRLYIDFIRHLPAEICLKILGYLDPVSLVSVLRTCRAWYDLALDRKLWENLYHLEGWKVIRTEIDAWEIKANTGVHSPIGHLQRIQTSDGHTSKIRAILNDDEDLEMTDGDRLPSIQESNNLGSIFGSPASSFSSNRQNLPSLGDMNLGGFVGKGKGVDRGFGLSEVRAKRKEPGGSPEISLPPIVQTDNIASNNKSALWAWDGTSSRYRLNWKYLYNMRRRLESNWELGKYKTFVLPHPDFPEEGHQECVYTLQFDADYLVSGSRDRTMRIWNMQTRRLVRPPLQGHSGSVLCLQFDADPSEDILVSGSSDSNVFIWKFSTGELIQRITKAHRESVLNVRFDKRVLVTSSKDKTIKIFNRRPLRYGDMGYPHRPDPSIDPVGVSVKAYGYEPDLAQELPVVAPFTMIGRLEGHSAAVNAIQIRDRTIVSVSGDRQIKVWNWPEQVCTQTIPAHDKGIACVEFDGRRIVSGSSDYEVCIFDAPTGLKVASLRGHGHLVRTVQAGFGDLPYSKIEDEEEAREVDAGYFRAVETGEIDHEGERRFRRGRRTNAGSSRPADLQAYGAKLPPGGGGGRKYGRIVSGSYDQSIIIWRRDKEGVWKPAHHLRQEEAAEAASRQLSAANTQRDNLMVSARAAVLAATPANQTTPQNMPGPSSQDGQQAQDPQNAHSHRQLIDQAASLGPAALRRALETNPAMLNHHDYLQAAIEEQPSMLNRTQLRQAVTEALRLQILLQHHQALLLVMPAPRGALRTPVAAEVAVVTVIASRSIPPLEGQANTIRLSLSLALPPLVNGQPHVIGAFTQIYPSTPIAMEHNPHTAGQTLQPVLRIMPAENAPARVFKLQFDARKIICCTQAPVIVGWDFCNGDSELEEVARFFATVD
ncbi:F-box/WD repeat-containing protein 1A [Cladobotryum mycophilum]|uniref:F-box/WD repeat-containing protein 1A n=1 Tax=Cladobotryum mycophilum TaxID=491253 RepID=A0ABR0SC02_9HYPO